MLVMIVQSFLGVADASKTVKWGLVCRSFFEHSVLQLSRAPWELDCAWEAPCLFAVGCASSGLLRSACVQLQKVLYALVTCDIPQSPMEKRPAALV